MRLYVLLAGQVCVDKGRSLTSGVDVGKRAHIPVPIFVLETDAGENVLIDTGLHDVHITDPEYTWRGEPLGELSVPVMRPEDYLPRRLEQISVRVDEVHRVINTHLHFDHAGCNKLFPHAPIYVQGEHYRYAKDNPLFKCEYWDDPALNYELVEGDTELLPGVHAIVTSGHTRGHQSLLIELSRRNVILCGDAIYCQDNIDYDAWEAGYEDPDAARASATKLLALGRQHDALVVYGHDPTQWRDLHHPPRYYE